MDPPRFYDCRNANSIATLSPGSDLCATPVEKLKSTVQAFRCQIRVRISSLAGKPQTPVRISYQVRNAYCVSLRNLKIPRENKVLASIWSNCEKCGLQFKQYRYTPVL